MPENHEFLPMSLVTFSKVKCEDIYLLYSKGFEHGPGIHRDGQGSPWMIEPETQTRKITDPHEQRKGTWLVNEDARQLVRDSMLKWTEDVIKKRDSNLTDPRDAELHLAYYGSLRSSLDSLPDYHSFFEKTYQDRSIIGIQGCGNLSMNEWYVAYICSQFTDNRPTFIALPEDRINRVPPRQYTCFIKGNGNGVERKRERKRNGNGVREH